MINKIIAGLQIVGFILGATVLVLMGLGVFLDEFSYSFRLLVTVIIFSAFATGVYGSVVVLLYKARQPMGLWPYTFLAWVAINVLNGLYFASLR